MILASLIAAFKITLTGFLIYRVQRFIRVHRTWELCCLLILFTFGIAFSLSDPSGTKNYEWLPTAVLILVLLIAFELELAVLINKLSENLNPNSFNRKNSALNEITRAASALAATKTGALIAFERNDSLLKFGDTGIAINADIGKELLTTLFTKDSPTHDGGVLIRGGRATHCGAVFPLSERRQIENGLGTRHRAALGLTEKTDAVCLIVSEEEGTISLAKGGELIYAVPPNELEGQMKKLLSQRERVRYYPLHYLKRYTLKLAEPNFILFSKSFTEKFYEVVVTVFWFAAFFLFDSPRTLAQADGLELLTIFLNTPWAYVPIALFGFNLAILLSSQKLAVDGALREIKKENRFLFLPLPGKKWTANNLKAVTVKRERSTKGLVALGFYTKKQKAVVLDRSTSFKTFVDYAKQIRDVLRIELMA